MKVAVGMSGGVDSTAAALLLKQQGHQVAGVTLCLGGDGCGSSQDAQDARAVAEQLGIEHYTLDLRDEFRRSVIQPFGTAYADGLTPNPCIECNRCIKFGTMLDWALAHGFDAIATGHYARIEQAADGYRLKTAADPVKDQSYVLYTLTQSQLAHTLFPLGEYSKPQLRELVRAQGLITAHKAESQDICFVPDGDYVGFLQRELHICPQAGDYLDMQGARIGTHRGVIAYTVGQRKGLGVAFGEPRFVVAKNAADNTVTLGRQEDLFSRSLTADRVTFCHAPLVGDTAVTVRTRYNQTPSPAVASLTEDGRLRVVFDTPQRAVTPGQAVVLYNQDTVLGGGRIVAAHR